ncbi:MAG TPA: response regulator transcription factor [Candidatus Dojkabacteria bacterium]|nr:response regulator transcription factor [Candidatus Dojkabacteria bacterium]
MNEKDILIVEDDNKIVSIIQNYLKDKCHVHIANTIGEARSIVKKKQIDLICQDIVLPDGDGLVFCNKVKQNYKNIKVIILTKKVFIEDRLKSFEEGADDYLAKPFFPDELFARIKRLLVLEKSYDGNLLKFNGLELDVRENSLKYEKEIILLSKSERLIIEALLLNEGNLSTVELIKYLSTKQSKVITTNAFMVSMNRLKTKLDKALGRKLIHSRYKFGYFLKV